MSEKESNRQGALNLYRQTKPIHHTCMQELQRIQRPHFLSSDGLRIGFRSDCSVFPVAHAHGGLPSYPKASPGFLEHNGIKIKEFPVGFKTLAGKHIIFSGGGYFRLLPYPLIKKWSEESSKYMMAYIHPRDLDAGQPMLEGLPAARKFKSYVGLKGAEAKLRRWLQDFKFVDVATANEVIDWGKVPVVRL